MPVTTTRADDLLHRLLATDEGRVDPYPLYKEIRAEAPFYRSGLDGNWYASLYDDCKAVLVEPKCGRTERQIVARYGQNPKAMEQFLRRLRATMLLQNPPEHTRLRGMVSRAFTPRRMADLGPSIDRMLEPLLDEMAQSGEVDVMQVLAFRLPVAVIGELVGVPAADREQFRTLVRRSQAAQEPGATPEMLAEAELANQTQEAYFVDLIARRRKEPTDDLLSGLIGLRDSGGPLSEDELVGTVRLLFGAGFVTTTNLIGNGLLTLFRHPGEMARLWADTTLAATAVDEFLRYESVVQTNGRTVMADVEIAGETLREGDTVITLIGGANRDPARFDDPERFDVGRRGEAPLSFGWGIHHCLGAPLARLEAQLVFTRFAERFETMELVGPEPTWNHSILRGVDALPVRVKPR